MRLWRLETSQDSASRPPLDQVVKVRVPSPARAEVQQLDQLTIRQHLAHELNERKASIPTILDALVGKAKRGDVPAARELRGWYDQCLGRPEAASLDTGDVDRPYQDVPLPAFVLISRLPELRWVLRTGSEADQDEALDEVRTESGEH